MKTKNTTNKKAFSLIEVLVVMAITGSIAAVSMPIYRNYLTGARVKTMMFESNEAKLYVESAFMRSQSLTTINVNYLARPETKPKSAHINCLTIQQGEITLIGKPSSLDNKNIIIRFTPTNQNNILSWSCSYSADAANYIKEGCTVASCASYSAWSNPVQISATEYFSYASNPASAPALYNAQCTAVPATFASCTSCYNFSNTATEERYMAYTLVSGSIYKQQCMQRTRSANNCALPQSNTSDPSANCQ